MKARLETGRIRFRVIFLLLVQTVCMAALPNGTAVVEQITGTVICTELSGQETSSEKQEPQSGIRQRRNLTDTPDTAAVQNTVCSQTALPCRRTPVRNKVRMDN